MSAGTELTPRMREEIEKINQMSHEEMARLRRFAEPGHPYFRSGPMAEAFDERFQSLGGMTTTISKRIGWEP